MINRFQTQWEMENGNIQFLSHLMLMIVDEMHSTTGQLNLLVPIGVAVACIERERAWQLA